jgi:hypothetical protein
LKNVVISGRSSLTKVPYTEVQHAFRSEEVGISERKAKNHLTLMV